MAGKTIVILGGGTGGLVTANKVRKRLNKEHRVVLVDKDARHILLALASVASGGASEAGLYRQGIGIAGAQGY